MRKRLVLCVLVAGCSSASTLSDAATDGANDVATDVVSDAAIDAASDVASDVAGDVASDVASDVTSDAARDVAPVDAQPVACGTETCSAAQICISVGGGAGISTTCVDLPAGCGGVPSCACLGAVCPTDAHHSCSVGERTASCNCLDCP